MVTEIQYTSIKRVLDDLLEHPLLSDLTLEQAVRHTLRFLSLHGYPEFYKDNMADVEIHDFRGLLPCDLISIIQVRDKDSYICLRAMTDSFNPGLREHHAPERHYHPNTGDIHNAYIPHPHHHHGEMTFKTQGRVIYTSFPEGIVKIAYKGIPVDEDGFPLLIDNETYLACLEAYIKKQVFTVKFDTGKLAAPILQNAQRDYALLAANLQTEFTTPSVNQAEAYSRMMTHLIPMVRQFDTGFRDMGDREYLRKH